MFITEENAAFQGMIHENKDVIVSKSMELWILSMDSCLKSGCGLFSP